jgi:hypothetical protein
MVTVLVQHDRGERRALPDRQRDRADAATALEARGRVAAAADGDLVRRDDADGDAADLVAVRGGGEDARVPVHVDERREHVEVDRTARRVLTDDRLRARGDGRQQGDGERDERDEAA